MKNTSQFCTIVGMTVSELHFGMDEEHLDCIALKLCLANRIAEVHAGGVMNFVCNCEWGVPLWTAEAVIALKSTFDIRLNIVQPFEGQADRYSKEVRERFFNVHSRADSVITVHQKYCEDCYRDADIRMIDNSDILLTDDADSFIARYAVGNGKRVVGIYNEM